MRMDYETLKTILFFSKIVLVLSFVFVSYLFNSIKLFFGILMEAFFGSLKLFRELRELYHRIKQKLDDKNSSINTSLNYINYF